MTKKPIIAILGNPEETKNVSGLEIITLDIDVFGKMVHFRIGVAVERASLADIVPLARKLSTKLAILFLDKLRENGQPVTCHKGCSACCSYLIPLSVPEVFRLREELLAMPTDYGGQILQSYLDTAERILDNKPPTFSLKNSSKSARSQIGRVSKWYSGLKLACPFLSDSLCTLYEQRPLACREHIATGSSFFCQPDHEGDPNVVPMPVSILEIIGQLAAELEQSDIEAVMLPLALPWAHANLERSHRSWPAVTMVKRFVEILKETAAKNSAISALST